MQPIYWNQFRIVGPGAAAECLQDAWRLVREDIGRMAPEGLQVPEDHGTAEAGGCRLEVQRMESAEAEILALTLESKAEGVRWRHRVRLCRVDEEVEADILVQAGHGERVIRPIRVPVRAPAVLHDLMRRLHCTAGRLIVDGAALEVDYRRVPAFAAWLSDPGRRVPVVAVSPRNRDHAFLVDADWLAMQLAGNAVVIVLMDKSVTLRLSDHVGHGRSCFDGAVRVYWPGFTPEDPVRLHPLFLRRRLEEDPHTDHAREQVVLDAVHGVASRFHFEGSVARRARDSIAAEAVERYHRELDAKALLDMYHKTKAERDEALARYEAVLEQLEAARRSRRGAPGDASTGQDAGPDAGTAGDVVDRSLRRHGRLRYSSNALRSGRGYRSRHLADLWLVLEVLDELAGVHYGGGVGMRLQDWLRTAAQRRGRALPKSSLFDSDSTLARYGDERTYTFGDRVVRMQKHFTIGIGDSEGCIHVYWEFNDDEQAIDVGYVGPHLSCTKA